MILTVTLNPAIDHTLSLSDPLVDGAVARTNDYQLHSGGKGINVSQYLRHLDVETVTTGILGGATGEFVRSELSDAGLVHDFVDVAERTRVNTTVLTPDAEYKINHDGPTVTDEAVDALIERIRDHDPAVVAVGGSLPPGLDAGAIDRIAEAGPWETAVDVGGELLADLESTYAFCKPNRSELAAATGMPVETLAQCSAAAKELRQQGFDRVVASLGADGALYVSADDVRYAEALDVDVVDTVGAGDALLSGVLAASAMGASADRTIRYGIAVSGRLVGVAGTRVDDLDDVSALADRVRVVDDSAFA